MLWSRPLGCEIGPNWDGSMNYTRDTTGTPGVAFSFKLLTLLASPTGFEPVLPP